MSSRGGGNNSSVILVRYCASFDVLQYAEYLFLQVTPCQPLFDKFHRRCRLSLLLTPPLDPQFTAVLKSISTFYSNCDKIDVCAKTCSKMQSAMQNLLEVITEYKEVALRRDSVGSSGKLLSSSYTCVTIGVVTIQNKNNEETINTLMIVKA